MRTRLNFFRRRLISFLAIFVLFASLTPSAQAADQRVIDIAELTWTGAPRPAVTLTDVQNSLNEVRTDWLSFTTLEGSTNQSSIEFTFGRSLSEPLRLNARFQCEATNFTTFISSVRSEVYKQLGITDFKDRYLVLLVPNSGCIWSGRALVGEAKTKGGSLVLHNTANSFIITHELGHSLGLGHSNLLRCASGAYDGAWSNDCKGVEYGGSIDVMGNVDTSSPLSVYHQWRMGLLDKSEIYQSWLNEKVTLSASDVKQGTRAIFLRDGNTSYWLEYRRPKAGITYNPGIVIYRGDPPPTGFVESPNPVDLTQANPGQGVSSDIWMLNLDSYSYSSTGRASGSMTLGASKSVTLQSKNISVSFTPGKDANSVEVTIDRKADQTPPPLPVLSEIQFWQFPDFPVLQNGYDDKETAISYYEIKKDEEVIKIEPELDKDFFPTYLSPLRPTPTLKVRELPEGKYSLQVRAIDIWGNASQWSAVRKISIDRGAPIFGTNYRVLDANESSAKVVLTDLRDPGSGLCETVMINPEGVVVARSTATSAPTFDLSPLANSASKIQTFDCLGNGRQASISANYTFIAGKEFRNIGKWKALPSSSAMQCVGKCIANFSIDGTVSVALGSGSAAVSVAGKEVARFAPATKSTFRLSDPITIGRSKRAIKVEGQNFILYGLSKASLQIGQSTTISRTNYPEDPSLTDPIQKTLSNYGFRANDFEQGWFVLPMGGGTTLNDPTLDFCNSKYLSDEKRLYRRQLAITKVGSPYLFLSSEVVQYLSEDAAKEAFAELISTAKKCIIDGGGTESGAFTKYSFVPLPNSKDPYQATNNTFFVNATIGDAASARTLLAFYQFNGNLFTGLYVVTTGAKNVSEAEINRWSLVAKVFSDRLKQN